MMNINCLLVFTIIIIVVLSFFDSVRKVEGKGGWGNSRGFSSSHGSSSSWYSSYSGLSNSLGSGSGYGSNYLRSQLLWPSHTSGSSLLKQNPNLYQYKGKSSKQLFVNDEKSSSKGKVEKFVNANFGARLNGKVII